MSSYFSQLFSSADLNYGVCSKGFEQFGKVPMALKKVGKISTNRGGGGGGVGGGNKKATSPIRDDIEEARE